MTPDPKPDRACSQPFSQLYRADPRREYTLAVRAIFTSRQVR